MIENDAEWDPDLIKALDVGDHIRHRPQMYLGSLPNPRVINLLVQEALCLSIDEALCGCCGEIEVAVHSNGLFTVWNDGPGLSIKPCPDGKTVAEILLNLLAGCRRAKRSEKARESCCSVGIVAVNHLSEWTKVRVHRDGGIWLQEFLTGKALGPFRRVGDATGTGLELSFLPDATIFGPLEFDGLALARWVDEVGLKYDLLEYRPADPAWGKPTTLHFRGVGPKEALAEDNDICHGPASTSTLRGAP